MGAVLALVILVTSPDFFALAHFESGPYRGGDCWLLHSSRTAALSGHDFGTGGALGFGVIAIGAVNDILYSKDCHDGVRCTLHHHRVCVDSVGCLGSAQCERAQESGATR